MPESLVVTVLSGVILLLLVVLIVQWKKQKRLSLRIAQLDLQQQEPEPAPEVFTEKLVEAEQSFQEQSPAPAAAQELPNRYRYVRDMARQGMNAAQIAKILQLGEEEAAQMVRLARLKRES